MDPNANLDEQHEIIARMFAGAERDGDALRLAELSQALDEWIGGGGFLPKAWVRPVATVWEETHNLTAAGWAEKLMQPSSMGRSLMPKPMPRDEFDGLLERRRGLEHATRELHVALTVARARGVEPVTVETLNTTQTMSLGLYARQIRREDLIAACEAWHVRRDPAARALIINYLNEEARPQ